MDIKTALLELEIDQVKLIRNKIAHTKQAMREMPELANQFQLVLAEYETQLQGFLEETV